MQGRRAVHSFCVVCSLYSVAAVSAAPTMEWVPVRVNALEGTYTINGSEVTILELAGPVSIELELRISGWGTAVGNPALGAYGATLHAPDVDGSVTAPLRIKGWPDTPEEGAFIVTGVCSGSGDPCSPPHDATCAGGANGTCAPNPTFALPGGMAFPIFPTEGKPNVVYLGSGGAGRADDGGSYHAGYLILDPTGIAFGTVTISLDTDNGATFLVSGAGIPIEGLSVNPAFITFNSGACCWNMGVTFRCENLMEAACEARPNPNSWFEGVICESQCCEHSLECDDCLTNADCTDADSCTDGICMSDGSCDFVPNYDVTTQCCDPATGDLTSLDDGNACTRDDCGVVPGTTTHTIVTAMPCDIQDRCAFATCSDEGVCTGVWPEDAAISCTQDGDCPEGWLCDTDAGLCHCIFDLDAPKNRYITFEPQGAGSVAYQVSMTASMYFPGSIGVLGWVGPPAPNRTAEIVAAPFFSDAWPSKVHVGDCKIVPVATYEVQDSPDGTIFGAPVSVSTIPAPTSKFWGDCVGDFDGVLWSPPNGVQNISDVQAAIVTFQAGASAAPLTWMDVEPEVPNRIVNINDVFALILAFKGEPYPFADPADCP